MCTTAGTWYCIHMTNTTNAATAHSTCSHPKTKVARARCRKARYLAIPISDAIRNPEVGAEVTASLSAIHRDIERAMR